MRLLGSCDVMVRHMDMCGNINDSGALAEGVWEYVNNLVKSYHSLESHEEESCQYEVRTTCICIAIEIRTK